MKLSPCHPPFIAIAETIALMKAKPVFVDIDSVSYNIDTFKIESAIAKKHNRLVQPIKDKKEVRTCDIYTPRFSPAKPLGCYDDGGTVLTNNNDEDVEKNKNDSCSWAKHTLQP